jgi:hypothetical protein
MASDSVYVCDNCGNGYHKPDVLTLRSYDHEEFVDEKYLCKKCDQLPIGKRNCEVVDFIWQCFLCGCYMDMNFFSHDDGCNMCFHCLGTPSNARVWETETGAMVKSYDVALELCELDDDNILVHQFNKRRAEAVIKNKKKESSKRQNKVMAYENVADLFVRFLPGLDMSDARDIASQIDVEKTMRPYMISDEYEFLEWMLYVKRK